MRNLKERIHDSELSRHPLPVVRNAALCRLFFVFLPWP